MKNIDKYVIDGSILTLDKRIKKLYKKGVQEIENIAVNIIKEGKVKE